MSCVDEEWVVTRCDVEGVGVVDVVVSGGVVIPDFTEAEWKDKVIS